MPYISIHTRRKAMKRYLYLFLIICLFALQACDGAQPSGDSSLAGSAINAPGSFTLTSSAFNEGTIIPFKYNCTESYSPPLSWAGAPAGTQSFVLILYYNGVANWVQYDIPGEQTSLDEALGGPSVGTKGVNYWGDTGYAGACPPDGEQHSNTFTLYALDAKLSLAAGKTLSEVKAAMAGHELGQATLTGIYSSSEQSGSGSGSEQSGSGTGSEQSGSGTGSEQSGSGSGSEQSGSGTGGEQSGSGTGSEQSGSGTGSGQSGSGPAGCAGSDVQAAELGAEVIRLTNIERAKVGLPPLTSNPELIKAAQGHAWDAACNNLHATGDPHTGSDGSKLKDRIERTQYPTLIESASGQVGENIAAGQSTPESAVDSWMKSTKGHRENILSKSFTEIGIGYVYNPDSTYKYYWVMVLGRPPFVLGSSAFKTGEVIPSKHADTTCSGKNYSPPLSWTGAPSGTKSFVLLLDGPGYKVHWVLFNIPRETTSLPEFIGGPNIGVKGKNSWGTLGYKGPCVPGEYVFSLFSVDVLLTLPEGATDSQVWDIVQTHSLTLKAAELKFKK
jgi:Raf kinase inhibitor-like YbhB/YbcL family protein